MGNCSLKCNEQHNVNTPVFVNCDLWGVMFCASGMASKCVKVSMLQARTVVN